MTQTSEELLPSTSEVNREQREYWTTAGPQQYLASTETNEALMAPFGQAMLDTARLRPAEWVLDVGCGFGTSTLQAAEQVAPSGKVVGIDISATMLETAHRRVADAGLDNIELLAADAQVHAFKEESFDAVISRFGTMFFDDPQAAFANFARALRSGGRLVFVCPQDPFKSEWVAVAIGTVVATLGRAPDLGPSGSPGPFAFADGDRLASLLTASGFRDVNLDSVTRPVRIGHTIDDAVRFIMSLPERRLLLAGAPDDVVEAVVTALGAAFAPYAGAEGVVLDSTAWLVSANC